MTIIVGMARHKQPRAVGDEAELERLLVHSPRFQALLEAARQRIRAGEGIPNEEFWRQVRENEDRKKHAR